MHHFTPGVHYEAVRYDLSDLPSRTYQLIQEAKKDPSRLERMAVQAVVEGLKYFNELAVIDSVAWILGRVKEVSPWEVRAPEDERGWGLFRFRRGWGDQVRSTYRRARLNRLRAAMPDLFL
jgi:hypothetical protein